MMPQIVFMVQKLTIHVETRPFYQMVRSYHLKIWSHGIIKPRGDIPPGHGPYLPLWQRSHLLNENCRTTNLDMSRTMALDGVIVRMQATKKAVINKAVPPTSFITQKVLKEILLISQFR